MYEQDTQTQDIQTTDLAKRYREEGADFARWAEGYGVLRHTDETQVRIHELAIRLDKEKADGVPFYDVLFALECRFSPRRRSSGGPWRPTISKSVPRAIPAGL